jgi:hypothetical protein
MRLHLTALAALAFAAALTLNAAAQDKDAPVTLKLVAKETKIPWNVGGLSPADLKKQLEDEKASPPAPAVDLVLQITNPGKEDVTIYMGGTANVYTFELKGPGAVARANRGPMPGFILASKATTLKPGETVEVPVKKLSDGRRGLARNVYWTEPGEYTLSATYQLTDAKGAAAQLLKSEPIKITVEAPK